MRRSTLPRHGDRVLALLFRHRHVDGREEERAGGQLAIRFARPEADPGVALSFGRSVHDLRDVAQEYGDAVHHVHDEPPKGVGIGQEIPGVDHGEGVGLVEAPGGLAHVRDAQCPGDVEDRGPARRQRVRIELHANHAGSTAYDVDAVGSGYGLELEFELLRDAPKRMVVDDLRLPAPERRDQDRDVVDLDRLDDPGADGRRNAIDVRVELVVDLDEAVFSVFSDEEADRNDGLTGKRHGVDVLDAVDLGQELLRPGSHFPLDLLDGEARRGYVDVRHRNHDLRLLLASGDGQREDACEEREHDEERSEGTPQEEIDDAPQCPAAARLSLCACHGAHPIGPEPRLAEPSSRIGRPRLKARTEATRGGATKGLAGPPRDTGLSLST